MAFQLGVEFRAGDLAFIVVTAVAIKVRIAKLSTYLQTIQDLQEIFIVFGLGIYGDEVIVIETT